MLKRYLPILEWLPRYDRQTLSQDLFAAVIVTLMVIPQALAYALLAGLPAVTGLYASMLPLVAYTVFGTSRTLAVGPMAIVSLMTAAALSGIVATGTVAYSEAAATLAFLSGVMLMLMGIFRLGFFANFLSHPVISGLLSASGVLIATSQLGNLLGISMSGFTLIDQLAGLALHWRDFSIPTALIGLGSLGFLMVMRRAGPVLKSWGLSATLSGFIAKAGPIIAVVVSTLLVWAFDLEAQGVAVVGEIPRHLPPIALPSLEPSLLSTLWMPALLISLVGFIESVSLAQMLAAKRRQRISPDQELFALGGSNLAAALSSSMPVTGSLSRTVINFDAGARTPAAGSFAALGVALVTLYLTPLIHFLPIATLAASIIVSTFTLLDARGLKRTWRYSKRDFAAMLATIVLTFVVGVEAGVMAGVGLSLALFLYRTSRPHSALVGRVPGTEHFRNVERYATENDPHVALLRVDESLYFANARYLEDTVYAMVAERPALKHVVLIGSAVNLIDASALESLEAINARLEDSRVKLHLAEVKGPVMDQLKQSDFLEHLTGEVFLSTYHAWEALREEDTVVTPLDGDDASRQD
ncbi:SulP family inorganic anion transporter [Chromohalobacter israelensis]|uniref:SulP family inorganic anion transporter n=1 Tax=Chromohalobacter israelensis TaxID=141390 RepID=UPI003AF70C4E